MSPWNECLANVPKACESVCCICVRGSFLFQWNCVQLRHGNLSTTTYRNRSSLRGTPKPFPTCPPVSIPKGGGGGGGGPPPLKSIPFQLNQFHGGGGGSYWFYQSFRGGGGGGGGWRALSFDKSILSRGQINFQPTPIFVNKNSSFALPELAFVKCYFLWKNQPSRLLSSLINLFWILAQLACAVSFFRPHAWLRPCLCPWSSPFHMQRWPPQAPAPPVAAPALDATNPLGHRQSQPGQRQMPGAAETKGHRIEGIPAILKLSRMH